MRILNFSFFIKIILEVIQEKMFDISKSITLLYAYCSIVNDITSVYCDKLKTIDIHIETNKYNWLSTILYNNKFYDDLIIWICIESLNKLAYELDSELIKKYIEQIKIIGKDCLVHFEKYNKKIIEEIKIHVQEYFKNNRLKDFLINSEKISLNYNFDFDRNSILAKFFISESDFKYLTDYLVTEYNKINKLNELKELLGLINELSDEQKIIGSFWVKVLNKIGIIVFWNFMLYLNFKNNKNNFVTQVKTFTKLNIYLYNGILYLEFIKKLIDTVSPYFILRDHVLKSNNKPVWFIEYNVELNNNNPNDYPSDINLISTIATHVINDTIGTKTFNTLFDINDINFMLGNDTFYENFNYGDNTNLICLNNFPYYHEIKTNLINNDPNVMLLNFNDWNSILESQSVCYLNLTQVFLTSHHMGREIGNSIIQILEKHFLNKSGK
jgi:hypothetical protein